jgi:hypothetical protein
VLQSQAKSLKKPEGKQFFFEKKTKKLLSLEGSCVFAVTDLMLRAMSKSFLLLFFKKEELPFVT